MITRRSFLKLSAAATLTTAATMLPCVSRGQGTPSSPSLPEHLLSGSKKKGLGFGPKNPLWPRVLTDLRCRWVYTWMGAVPPDLPEGMQFIPMVRSRFMQADQIQRITDEAKGHGITELLGLNEPDAPKQDDMTVEAALEAWPLLMETGMRLGSPGCIHPDNEWMTQFMAGIKERDLRVDFVCVHSYGGPDANAFLKKLERTHKLYGRPLWITEFGVGDWKARTVEDNKHSPETVLRFMDRVLPALDDLDYLERYAWFPAKPDNPALGTNALFDESGTLTELGVLYRDA